MIMNMDLCINQKWVVPYFHLGTLFQVYGKWFVVSQKTWSYFTTNAFSALTLSAFGKITCIYMRSNFNHMINIVLIKRRRSPWLGHFYSIKLNDNCMNIFVHAFGNVKKDVKPSVLISVIYHALHSTSTGR